MGAPLTPSTQTAAPTGRRSARERLLAAADELFYEGGIHAVGIERIIERAGVAKASLYDTFGSKDELIRAYLESRAQARKTRIQQRLARYTTPREQVLGLFEAQGELFARPEFRGCAFVRASSEAPPRSGVKAVCDDTRAWIRNLFAELARRAGAADPDGLARQLAFLYDGATVSAQMDGSDGVAPAARDAAGALLDAAIAAGAAAAGVGPGGPSAQ